MSSSMRTPLRDVIADDLRQQIIRGTLRPGARILEEQIAAAHGVSRVPVREAMRRLEAEGYLALTPFRGATVTAPSINAAVELMQIRRALEGLAARLAAARHGGDLADELQAVVTKGRQAIRARRVKRLPELIETFHDLVVRASGNQELIELLGHVRSKVRWVFDVDVEARADSSWHDHEMILQAILGGDAHTAGVLMDAHVAKDEQVYRSKLDTASSVDE
jgi:DNA-binding GntR family transcriptional regulator